MADLIKLRNSNALVKYTVDADELNYNFQQVASGEGGTAAKNVINSSGQTYNPLFEDQLAIAIAQYVASAGIYGETGNGNAYQLSTLEGLAIPYRYSNGMIVTFRPPRTNSGPCTIGFEGLTAYPVLVNGSPVTAGYMTTGAFQSFMLTYDKNNPSDSHWTPVITAESATSGSEASGDAGDTALLFIELLIESAGLSYNPGNVMQLARAVANYIDGRCYKATTEGSTYKLTGQNGQEIPTMVFEGMVVAFIADTTSTNNTPMIQLGELDPVNIVSYNGNALPAGAIAANQLCVCQYKGDAFRFVSQYMPTFTMDGSRVIKGVSNDPTMADNANDMLVTQQAVKGYVDSQLKTSDKNVISNAYQDGNGDTVAMNVIGSRAIGLVTSPLNDDGTKSSTVIEHTFNNNTQIFSSSNTETKVYAVSKVPGAYWETATEGWAIDNCNRYLSGGEGAYSVAISDINAPTPSGTVYWSDTYGVYFNTNPMATEYFGFTGLTGTLPDYVRVRFTDKNHTPYRILLEVNPNNGGAGSTGWLTLGDLTYESDSEESDYGEAGLDTDYGILKNCQVEADGTYLIPVRKYVVSGESIVPFDNSTNPYSLRMLFIDCSESQFPGDAVNQPGYDPNTDTTSEMYSIQIEDIGFGDYAEVPPFTVVYYNGTTETVTRKLYYTQYYNANESESEESGASAEVALLTIADGDYVVYLTENAQALRIANKENIYTQSAQPTASILTEGGVWVDTSTTPYTTYICTETIVDDVVTYTWEPNNLILLGEVTVSSGAFTSGFSYASGSTRICRFTLESGSAKNYYFNHNFGTSVKVEAYLKCLSTEYAYNAGAMIKMDGYNGLALSTTADPDNVGEYILEETPSYFQLSYNNATVVISYSALQLPIRSGTGAGQYATITPANWEANIIVHKD